MNTEPVMGGSIKEAGRCPNCGIGYIEQDIVRTPSYRVRPGHDIRRTPKVYERVEVQMHPGWLCSLCRRAMTATEVVNPGFRNHDLYPNFRVQDPTPVPVSALLRDLAAAEGHDGEPWDFLVHVADYVNYLEQRITNLEARKERP